MHQVVWSRHCLLEGPFGRSRGCCEVIVHNWTRTLEDRTLLWLPKQQCRSVTCPKSDESWEPGGRVDLNTEIDTEGPNSETRNDLGSAFGDWETVREQVLELSAPVRVDTDLLAALRSAERDPAGCSDDEYRALAIAEGAGMEAVVALADALRKDAVGEDVTHVGEPQHQLHQHLLHRLPVLCLRSTQG